jgi:hypothetical protein
MPAIKLSPQETARRLAAHKVALKDNIAKRKRDVEVFKERLAMAEQDVQDWTKELEELK